MGASQLPAKERVALLSHAIDLCTTLRDTLERIGPSRWTRSPDFLSADEHAIVLKMHELESTLQRHLQEVNEKRNYALSPVSRLPDDVLRLIFLYMVDPEPDRDDHRSYIDYIFVEGISRVSRRWRAVVLDTATLWADVSFADPKYLADTDSDPIHPWYGSAKVLTRTAVRNLERSKLALLRVSMDVPAEPSVPAMVREYMRTCSGRVGELTLTVGREARLLDAIVPCIAQTAGVLRRFRFSVEDALYDVDGREAVEQLLALHFPSLVDVRLTSIPLPLRHRQEYTALLGCRHLRLTIKHPLQFHLPQLLALLKCTPVLEDLYVTLMTFQDAAPPELEERLLLPELRNLNIRCPFSNIPHLPLVILSAPKLDRLALDYSYHPHDNAGLQDRHAPDIVAFLAASVGPEGKPPPVRTLAIKGGMTRGLDRILPALPELEVLRVVFDQGSIAEQELEVIALIDKLCPPIHSVEIGVPPPASFVCQRLRTLESLAFTTPSHLRPLIRLAARRKTAGIPLTRVRMDRWPSRWMSGGTGMPETPEEQYALERALASEVDMLDCGQYRWDWDKGSQAPDGTRGGWSKVD
ncbi:hypothetical protein CALVIDRAFT_527113 [Calocera viscosa TUFC12733]|uniref:Uncharacterized protein n=1 Tax=Calocera viscosa (strain TUFC12733) TaxID=1330018 RepID=A0A167MJN5_CALVF|nr:hypothetical protein CALVIDRAFT_527113 [Calocera viscosa TUFC12733]